MVVEIDEPTKLQLQQILSGLDHEVTLHLFTDGAECLFCNDTKDLVNKISALSERSRLCRMRALRRKERTPWVFNELPRLSCMA